MKKKPTIDEHRQGLIELYKDQLEHKTDTTFMEDVLKEAIRRLELNANPQRVENWVVKRDKESLRPL